MQFMVGNFSFSPSNQQKNSNRMKNGGSINYYIQSIPKNGFLSEKWDFLGVWEILSISFPLVYQGLQRIPYLSKSDPSCFCFILWHSVVSAAEIIKSIVKSKCAKPSEVNNTIFTTNHNFYGIIIQPCT